MTKFKTFFKTCSGFLRIQVQESTNQRCHTFSISNLVKIVIKDFIEATSLHRNKNYSRCEEMDMTMNRKIAFILISIKTIDREGNEFFFAISSDKSSPSGNFHSVNFFIDAVKIHVFRPFSSWKVIRKKIIHLMNTLVKSLIHAPKRRTETE